MRTPPKRSCPGRYEIGTVGGEEVRSYIPASLPPSPPLLLTAKAEALRDRANRAIGRLDGLSLLLPDTSLFLYMYIRKEAVLSSQIEGTQSSLSDLLLFESAQAPGVPLDDVEEVANYVTAMEHGLRRIREENFPLSSRLLKEIHSILLAGGRGSRKNPGEFRRSQNWIGGSRPGNAIFVPPPPHLVDSCMGELENFLHDKEEETPTLIKAALAHLQFETIHPFLDGNGRLGRLLITLLLCTEKALHDPLLYLSLYFKENRETYYGLLQEVRENGTWEKWIEFFLQGVLDTAEAAIGTARDINQRFSDDLELLESLGRAAGSALRIHRVLQKKPIITIGDAADLSGVSQPTVLAAFERMITLNLVRELTGKERNRVYVYQPYLEILVRGM